MSTTLNTIRPLQSPLATGGEAAPASRPAIGRLQQLLRIVALAYAVLLSYLLLAPEPLFFLGSTGERLDAAVTRTVADWVEHACVYFVFTGLVLAAWQHQRRTVLLLSLLLAHAILTETLQHWVPFRETSFQDLLANAFGILTGALAMLLIEFLRPAPAISPMAAENPRR